MHELNCTVQHVQLGVRHLSSPPTLTILTLHGLCTHVGDSFENAASIKCYKTRRADRMCSYLVLDTKEVSCGVVDCR
jgi:hypothetical protein